MVRSVWKGPFVEGSLLKKADAARASGRHDVIKIWSRRSTILPQFVGLTFGVYNGQKHVPVAVNEEMGRSQVRRVLADPDLPWPLRRQESQEGLRIKR
ncbi:ribosomal protein S19 [Bradyrhizobium sp. LB9.1b]